FLCSFASLTASNLNSAVYSLTISNPPKFYFTQKNSFLSLHFFWVRSNNDYAKNLITCIIYK
ncbi:hypothetical protein ACIPPT_02390, partial [Wolbachia endosymbiont of Drosophila bicornuta]